MFYPYPCAAQTLYSSFMWVYLVLLIICLISPWLFVYAATTFAIVMCSIAAICWLIDLVLPRGRLHKAIGPLELRWSPAAKHLGARAMTALVCLKALIGLPSVREEPQPQRVRQLRDQSPSR